MEGDELTELAARYTASGLAGDMPSDMAEAMLRGMLRASQILDPGSGRETPLLEMIEQLGQADEA
ncbi:hypothetical protein C41B8_05343 [Salinisphaera hydrothermalis C41B8]|uniref:Uncharacterized protein n=1 Tax=Salinisphaera hydrothermalis (strain C41B8) TaxID=1304275 RepID=A0A084INL6_SALHC|nr:hypothetical protein C41B8_05343 [Salinisphaera hydrothermalis C41B8]